MESAEDARPVSQVRLWSLLAVVGSLAFVTLLIAFEGRLAGTWTLYLVPIVIAGIAFGASGAVVASATCVAALMLAAPPSLMRADALAPIISGFVVFTLTGVVVGRLSQRQRAHTDELERASITDVTTGLYKTEHFLRRLDEEVARCDRYDVPVGLVLVRAAGHGDFVEHFGHYKADLMLAHMADVLRITVRTTDIVAKCGPCEFAIVLPFSTEDDTRFVADRVMRAVVGAEYEGDVLEPVAHTTADVSLALYPSEAVDAADLLRIARERLSTNEDADPCGAVPDPRARSGGVDLDAGQEATL